jgi:bifunctional UDP-N-acetylglucosamine pyrophosphorylase/glucosamine-1-phosphate N-acetyltransferase
MKVNDPEQLAEDARQLRSRLIEKLTSAGVTFEDPETVFMDEGVEIGPDTVIRPLTFLEGATRIGSGSRIGPNVRLVDSTVGDSTEVTFAVVLQSKIGSECQVGPFAYLRPGAELSDRTKVGTFVEVKGSTIGEGSKVPHLSYIGDAEIGKDVNVGAGTITGNYDAETGIKSKTIIEDGALTGSDTTLIAPVRLGRNAVTGAGAVVTKDVEPGEVVVGIPARPMRKRKPKKAEDSKDAEES